MTKDEALKLALDALDRCGSESYAIEREAITAIKEALAQPEHEWVCGECVKCGQSIEQPEQEPVAWKDKTYGNLHHQDFGNSIPLYTTPPQEQQSCDKRKPLTDEQIIEMYNEPRSDKEMIEFARAIEQAHGIKGEA